MSTVWIADNPLESEWEKHDDVNSVNELLSRRWTAFPPGAKIYWKYVAENCDVTPRGTPENVAAMADRLDRLSGQFFVIVEPQGPILIIAIIAIVIAVAAIVAVFIFRPSTKQQNSASPNNSLSDRQNTARPNERINDIVGCIRSVPDVIGPPYRVFIGNQEVEYGYYCIGNGEYTISKADALVGGDYLWDIKDDATPLQQMDGSSAAVYAPFTSPNSGAAPILQIGPAFTEPLINVQKSSSVIGQILRAPNDTTVGGSGVGGIFTAHSDGTITCSDSNTDFTAYFGTSDHITFDNGGAPVHDSAGIQPDCNLDGTYVCASVTANTLTFVAPSAVNAGWLQLASYGGMESTTMAPRMTASGSRWVGPYVLDVTDMTEVWCNFVAPNGLYKVSSSSGNQYRIDTSVEIEIWPLDEAYNPVGLPRYFSATVIGSAIVKSQRASTLKAVLPLRTDGKPAGRVQVRALRVTTYDTSWEGTNADEVQWRDLMAISPVIPTDFGDVTTIQTSSFATASALVAAQRKLNLEVTRNIPVRTPASPVAPDPTHLEPSRNAADIAIFIARDPYIGNRPDSELNFADIYAQLGNEQTRTVGGVTQTWPAGAVANYFGTDLCAEFCYTFDDTQTTFEEMMTDVGAATFCTPYRRGSLLSFFFERQQSNGVLLFNHRNKVPGSETRTVNFGLNSDYDGIELDYIDPAAPNYPQVETTVTLHFPPDQSATNAKKITSVGVRNNVQAQLLGWRYYNKLMYNNTAVEFKSTAEAALIINTQRMLVADNTRPDTQDGEVLAQVGLTLTLSQPVNFSPGSDYVIFLQQYDGTLVNIPITPGPNVNQVILQYAPPLPLVTDDRNFARTTYQIVGPPAQHVDVHEADVSWDGTYCIINDRALDGLCTAGSVLELVGVIVQDSTGANVDLSGVYDVDHVMSGGGGSDDIYLTGGDWSFMTALTPPGSTSTREGEYVVNSGSPAPPPTPFLLTQKTADDGNIYNVQAINYDDRYYNNDNDFISGALLLNDIGVSNAPFPDPAGGGY